MFREQRIADYLAGDLTPAARAAFERDIVSDPEGLAELVAQQCLDASLRALLDPAPERVESAIMATVRGVTDEAAVESVLGDTIGRRKAKPRQLDRHPIVEWFKGKRWQPFLWTAAACLVVAIVLTTWFSIQRAANYYPDEILADAGSEAALTTKSVAQLTHSAGVVWAQVNGKDFAVGAALSPGWLRLKSGIVSLAFSSGAQAILEGPAELELVSGGEARLHYGKINFHVPTQAHGFRLRTAGSVVTDLGTDFGVWKCHAQSPEVHVFTGKVEVALANSTQAPRVLTQGHAIKIRRTEVRDISADSAAFVSAEDLNNRENEELHTRYASWRSDARTLDNDPAIVLHYDFQDNHTASHNLANRAAASKPDTHGVIAGTAWTQGRWPEKGALEFKKPTDRVRIKAPAPLKSATYLAWVSVDSLPNSYNALALGQRAKPGELHWQIHANGSIELAVLSPDAQDTLKWDKLVTKPVITSERFHQWLHLAAIYDAPARTMSVYLNGQLIDSRHIEQLVELNLAGLELGNWSPGGDTPAGRKWLHDQTANYLLRDFHGRMDEFALLSRPLSADEIHRDYLRGKPGNETVLAAR